MNAEFILKPSATLDPRFVGSTFMVVFFYIEIICSASLGVKGIVRISNICSHYEQERLRCTTA